MPDRSPPLVPPARTGVIRFDRYTLDRQRRQLLADGVPLPIGSRAFDLLDQLVSRAGHPVDTDALRRAVWPDRKVGDNNLRVQITALRKLLGEGVIALDATRGYRFTLPVDEGGSTAAAEPAAPGKLPAYLPPLYGRDDDLAALLPLLTGQARVSLVGPAGVGKTSLALAAAHRLRREPADGVWWVELAALREPAQIADGIAALLQIKLSGESGHEALAIALAKRQMLLVLDNCEHLIDGACAVADALLRHAPRVALLATSRRPLKCAGEQALRLGPLGLPEGNGLGAARRSGAVAWFEARAQRADPSFALTAGNAEAVTSICRALDGVPMAIGLAAARVPLLGVAGLRERLADRLRLLASAEPDPRGHPQALLAALDWSHELLTPPEQTVLRRLSVFAGSFALASVHGVAGDETLDERAVQDALNALIDHSWVQSDRATLQAAAPARYTLHESVRLYARQRLEASGEAEALQARHAQHVLDLVIGIPPRPVDDWMTCSLPDADYDNLRAAITWAREQDIALALSLANSGNRFLRMRGHHRESRRIGLALISDLRTAAHRRELGLLHLSQATINFEQNDLDRMLDHALAARDLLSGLPEATWKHNLAWTWLGMAYWKRNEPDKAEPALRQALRLHRESGHEVAAASDLNYLGLVMVERRRLDEARAMFGEALALNRRHHEPWGTAMSLKNLGELAYAQGDFAAAQAHWEAALPVMRQLGHAYQSLQLLIYVGLALRRQGQPETAQRHSKQALRLSIDHALPGHVADALILFSALMVDRGDRLRATVLLCLSDAQRAPAAPPIGPAAIDRAETEAALRRQLPDAAWTAARLEADRLTPAGVLDLA